jgi:large subunit ribosomal protein L11
MAKQLDGYLKLQVRGGQANPAPPVGPALGSKGINIMEFCNQFNARTDDRKGQVLPVVISIYKDKSFDFVIKTPPAAVLILQAANKKKGSDQPNLNKVASITWDQVKDIAETKMKDLNAFKVSSAMKMIAGTARSMGVKGAFPENIN